MVADDEGYGPIPPRPACWADVWNITGRLSGVPISVIETGRIDWEYDFDTKDMQPCGREGCEQRHAHGFVVAIPGRRYVNIGCDCAKKYAQTHLHSAQVAAYKERLRSEARLQAVAEARAFAQAKLDWLANNSAVEDFIRLHESFCAQVRGPLLDALRQLAEKGKSAIEVEVRLTAEERQTRMVMQAGNRRGDEPLPPVPFSETRRVAELAGLEILRPSRDLRELAARLRRLSVILLNGLPDNAPDAAIRHLIADTRELGPMSNDLNAALNAARRFYTDENLAKVLLLPLARRQGFKRLGVEAGSVVAQRSKHWGPPAAA